MRPSVPALLEQGLPWLLLLRVHAELAQEGWKLSTPSLHPVSHPLSPIVSVLLESKSRLLAVTQTWGSASWSLGCGLSRVSWYSVAREILARRPESPRKGCARPRVSQELWRNLHRPWSLEASACPQRPPRHPEPQLFLLFFQRSPHLHRDFCSDAAGLWLLCSRGYRWC